MVLSDMLDCWRRRLCCRKVLLAGVAVLTATFVAVSSTAQETGYLVERKHLKCVIDNLAKYEAEQTDPVFIFLEICPELRITAELLERLIRNELPDIRSRRYKAGEPERVLPLTKAELKCISKYRELADDVSRSLIQLPAKLCQP